MSEFHHVSVMLRECIDGLNIRPEGIYVDGTLGGAGHSYQIASRLTSGTLIGIDRDNVALPGSGWPPSGTGCSWSTATFPTCPGS